MANFLQSTTGAITSCAQYGPIYYISDIVKQSDTEYADAILSQNLSVSDSRYLLAKLLNGIRHNVPLDKEVLDALDEYDYLPMSSARQNKADDFEKLLFYFNFILKFVANLPSRYCSTDSLIKLTGYSILARAAKAGHAVDSRLPDYNVPIDICYDSVLKVLVDMRSCSILTPCGQSCCSHWQHSGISSF